MAEPAFGLAAGVHRPRNVDWKRAAALLYGDWGTSKAYVIGLAFVAVSYLGVRSDNARLATAGLILVVGIINYFGPRHSGSVSIWLAVPAVLVVVLIVVFSGPHLKVAELEPAHSSFAVTWIQFVGVILALSGVEAVAN